MTQLTLKSYNKAILDIYISYLIKNSFKSTNLQVVNLPNKIKKITLLKSPHVFKKSKDHYQETLYTTVLFMKCSDSLSILNIIKNVPKTISIRLKK